MSPLQKEDKGEREREREREGEGGRERAGGVKEGREGGRRDRRKRKKIIVLNYCKLFFAGRGYS